MSEKTVDVQLTRRAVDLYLEDDEGYETDPDVSRKVLHELMAGAPGTRYVKLSLSRAQACDVRSKFGYIAMSYEDLAGEDPNARGCLQTANNATKKLIEAGAESITEFNARVNSRK